MYKTKSKLAIFLTIFFTALFTFSSCNIYSETNLVAGTYQEKNLSIILEDDYSFSFYSAITNSTSNGTYSYTLSEDEKYAYVVLNVTTGSCSYDGATIFSIDETVYLVPKIGSKEVTARTMKKV